ncbi:UNVERIFIED_CONTAM: hypothetical protein Cloal_3560 [Acetivibrio alkalicellulosi]
MEYYLIYQDNRIENFAEPMGVSKIINMDDLPVQFYIKDKSENEYIDFIEKPVTLISEKLKQIFEIYQKGIFYKPVVLADKKRMRQDLYWLMLPQKRECLSLQTEFNKNDTIKRIVIDEKKAGNYSIFSIDGIIENFIVVNLDVAESVLRSDFFGIKFKKVEVEC